MEVCFQKPASLVLTFIQILFKYFKNNVLNVCPLFILVFPVKICCFAIFYGFVFSKRLNHTKKKMGDVGCSNPAFQEDGSCSNGTAVAKTAPTEQFFTADAIKKEKRRIYKNILVISLAFLFNFNAFQVSL